MDTDRSFWTSSGVDSCGFLLDSIIFYNLESAGEALAGQRGHVAGHSRPSDQAHERLRLSELRSFCKKKVFDI
jgi:hypothetical protein